MPKNLDAMQLLVQLKILKELRILNKTLTNGLKLTYGHVQRQDILSQELEDVRDVMCEIGHAYV